VEPEGVTSFHSLLPIGFAIENTKTTCFASVRFFIPLRLQKQAFDAFRNKKTHSKEWVFVL
jgi:hypothetical protein